MPRCVDSILSQTYRDFRLILVDDGSPDRCPEICDDYAAKDSRVHVIHQANAGLSAARNAGLDFIRDQEEIEFVSFVDSDDWIEPTYIATLLDGASLGTDFVSLGYSSVTSDGVKYARFRDKGWKILPTEEFWVGGESASPVSAWGKLYRKTLFDGVRYPVGRLMEDAFTTYKLAFKCSRIATRNLPLYNYNVASPSILRSEWSPSKMDDVDAFAEAETFFESIHAERARSWAFRQKLTSMAVSLKPLESVDPERARAFRESIRVAKENGLLPFWESRILYGRILGRRSYAFRWFFAMLMNALTQGRNSWLLREAPQILRMLIERRRAR